MARHRSPSGRRAHLGPPLIARPATAGVGGAARAAARISTSTGAALGSSGLRPSTPLRLVAIAVAGGAVAAAGQQVLAHTLPAVVDGAGGLLGSSTAIAPAALASPQAAIGAAALPAPAVLSPAVSSPALSSPATRPVEPVAAAPVVADAANLVKAAGLAEAAQKLAAEAARRAAAPAVTAGGAVQMIVGRVTSGFGGRWGTTHQGLDITAPIGTPVHVPEAGTVISSGPASGFGMWVRVQHADGTITVYGHINRSLVKVGQRVAAGDVIAETGNRGQSTGPHLHIGVMQGGKYVNPQPWLDAHDIGY